MKTTVVSGGFDPLHIGHLRMLEASAKNSKLTVILNNDNWLRAKKGFVFMPQEERREILKALRCVDDVVFSIHSENPTDMSVSRELALLKPDYFANGGDRDNVPEEGVCKELGIQMFFGVGGEKIQSSSNLVKQCSNVLQ